MGTHSHQRLAEAMRAKRAGNEVRVHRWQGGEIRRDPMADDMHFAGRRTRGTRPPREIAGQRVVGHVHPAVRGEITGDQEPHVHLIARRRVAGIVDTACTAPDKNQNCMPIWVTNGVKLKISAAVPRFAANAIAAQARTLGFAS